LARRRKEHIQSRFNQVERRALSASIVECQRNRSRIVPRQEQELKVARAELTFKFGHSHWMVSVSVLARSASVLRQLVYAVRSRHRQRPIWLYGPWADGALNDAIKAVWHDDSFGALALAEYRARPRRNRALPSPCPEALRAARVRSLLLARAHLWRLTPQFSGGALRVAARRERIMK